MSISSAKSIQGRTLNFCKTIEIWSNNAKILEQINDFLNTEYDLIPETERIGKGIKFISNHVAKGVFHYLLEKNRTSIEFIIDLVEKTFNYGESTESNILELYALHIIAEYILAYPEEFEKMVPLIQLYACHGNWIVRETILEAILAGLKKKPIRTLELLSNWTNNSNQNLRRLVSESLRPHTYIKWLRDPAKNDKIIDILTILRNDPSIYVRKSVGNNLKDLSKYMPEKILELMESWIKNAQIEVHDGISNEIGLSKENKRLIWTMKHAMRWLKTKNPEFHPLLEKILGKNYVLYFDEKRNRLAKPKK